MEDKKLLILVVDDSVVQLHHAVQICLETGAEVVSARDGQEALEILRREPVDVALIDLEMPVMDGVELISQIATEKLTENIVILSSKDASLISSVGSMAEADGLTVLASVSKPITNTLIEEFLVKFGAKINDKSLSEIESGDDFYVSYDELLSGINGQQFLLHYQPKLTCKGLLLKGVEALARWEHPERGFIPPTIFIAAAEKYQLIGPLTMMIFEQALTQKKRWQDKGLNFNLALNLSPQSLVSTEFANSLDEFVRNHDVKPSDVTL